MLLPVDVPSSAGSPPGELISKLECNANQATDGNDTDGSMTAALQNAVEQIPLGVYMIRGDNM